MLQLTNVSKHFGHTVAVNNISFEVKQGETVALLGTSGCGKTTTLRMLNRLTEPTSGDILVNGKNIMQQPAEALRRTIGYVLQHHGLFPHYTVAENIAVVPNLLKWQKEKTTERTEELLAKLELPQDIAHKYPAQLSGGQQQRIGVARALAAKPSVLLMDEPFGALDPVTRSAIRKQFLHLDELKQCTILLVTHDVQEAFELADKICLMDKGSLIQFGTPVDLLYHPAHPFVASFLKEQHLQLELETIAVKDCWSYFPKAEQNPKATSLSSSVSLWHVLETLSSQPGKAFCIEHGVEQKPINASSVMSAYTLFKNAPTHE